jgi:outer membrane protein assembly factor BamE (lipoprotein component of BamABCDE complex)
VLPLLNTIASFCKRIEGSDEEIKRVAMQFTMQIKHGRGKRMLKIAALGLVVAGLAGCTSSFRKHGYVPAQEDLDNVIVGVDTVETVSASVPRPSGRGVLEGGDWFFVESNWRHYGYRPPQEIDREVVAIRFDDDGVVENIERFGLEDGKVIVLSRRVTTNNVDGVSFIGQMFGSFGNNIGQGILGSQ